MFYYYFGAITFSLVISLSVLRVVDLIEHPRKQRKHKR